MTLERVVIAGGGMGGLLAAAAVSPYAARVMIVEKDAPPEGPEPRRGVP